MPKWMEEYTRRADEPLIPELEPYVEQVGPLGEPSLRHPLVYQVPLFHPWQANDQYTQKIKAIHNAVKEQDFHSYVFLHERPYRAVALENIATEMGDREYWELAAGVWTDTENHWQERIRWNRLLRSNRLGKRFFMDEDERETFTALPDALAVYRGWNGQGTPRGLAWTLDRAKGVWFAQRLAGVHEGTSPTLVTGLVLKVDTLGLLQHRGEDEIVIPRPIRVGITETEEI